VAHDVRLLAREYTPFGGTISSPNFIVMYRYCMSSIHRTLYPRLLYRTAWGEQIKLTEVVELRTGTPYYEQTTA
jgi:hypothetical protein